MSSILPVLLTYLLLYKYTAIFFVVFVSAIILPLPVNTMLLAIGAFSSQHYFNFWLAFGVALAANVSGDLVDYLLTRTYGQAIIKNFYLKRQSTFARLEGYMRKHAGPTVFATRFSGISDIVANFLAGLADVPPGTFLLFDILGNIFALFWILALGYLAGDYWQDFSGIISIVGSVVFVGIVGFISVNIFYRRNRAG